MWAYNNQHESATGCWHASVCAGTTYYTMFDGRSIDFFCSAAQKASVAAAAKGNAAIKTVPYPIVQKDASHFPGGYKESCSKHDDCKDAAGKRIADQWCALFLWDATKDGTSWGNGSSCYSYDDAPCDSELTVQPWRSVNLNYDTPKTGTLFSYSTNFMCPGLKSASGSKRMMGSAAMIMGFGGAAALF